LTAAAFAVALLLAGLLLLPALVLLAGLFLTLVLVIVFLHVFGLFRAHSTFLQCGIGWVTVEPAAVVQM
jgi:hypothetical protein